MVGFYIISCLRVIRSHEFESAIRLRLNLPWRLGVFVHDL